jgi:hypothetical protein
MPQSREGTKLHEEILCGSLSPGAYVNVSVFCMHHPILISDSMHNRMNSPKLQINYFVFLQ